MKLKSHFNKTRVQSTESGQVVVEYVLLLIVLVSIGFIIVNGLVGRGSEPGAVIRSWNLVLNVIAQDLPEVID